MRASCAITASGLTSAICCGTCRGWITTTEYVLLCRAADCGAGRRARRELPGRRRDGARLLAARTAAHSARSAPRGHRPVSRAALRAAAARRRAGRWSRSTTASTCAFRSTCRTGWRTRTRAPQCGSATHRANRVLTVSEASKRDILRYFRVPEEKIDVIYNAIDERFGEIADGRGGRARPRALSARTIRSSSTPATSSRTRTSSG